MRVDEEMKQEPDDQAAQMHYRYVQQGNTRCVMHLDKLNLVKLGYDCLVLGSSQFLLLPLKKYCLLQKWSKVSISLR